MSKHRGEVHDVHEPFYTRIKGVHPDGEIYYFPDEETGRCWYVTRLSETRYSYIYFTDGTFVEKTPTTQARWNDMVKKSYLVVDTGVLPYAHRN